MLTIAEIKKRLEGIDSESFAVFERSLQDDERKGVQQLLAATHRKLEAQTQEKKRLASLYAFDAAYANGGYVVGLDEVGRGPLAGPLTIGAVVWEKNAVPLEGLNDSKQVSETKRPELAHAITETALCHTLVFIEPADIDTLGMSACLRKAFTQAIKEIDIQAAEKGISITTILLDGNPLHLDEREVSVVKGDSHSASIAAASLIAKVARDELMVSYDKRYPGYDFKHSKGYGSKKHCEALVEKGLSPIHRKTFCQGVLQERLF